MLPESSLSHGHIHTGCPPSLAPAVLHEFPAQISNNFPPTRIAISLSSFIMVYCGQLSKSCHRCRRRKIKASPKYFDMARTDQRGQYSTDMYLIHAISAIHKDQGASNVLKPKRP